MIKYPASIDTSLELPTVVDNVTPINGALLNNIRDAILAMENELGIKPSGIYTNVRTRIAAIETVVGNLQIISLTKDLGGTLALPVVVGLQGTPVSSTTPTANQALVFNGIRWTPTDLASGILGFTAGGDLSGTTTNQTVIKINGTTITTAGGALSVGATLRVTAAGTADWGALDLADTDAITGILPKGNQQVQDMAGDVTGNTGVSVVTAIQGVAVNAMSPDDGYVLAYDLADGYWHATPPTVPQSIIFKPGSTSIGNTVATWTEVVTHINATNGLLDVYVDASLATPTVSASVDCKGRTRFIGIERYVIGGSNFTLLDVPDGFIITNPASFYGLTLSCTGNAVIIALTITSAQTTFECTSIYMSVANNTPIITIVVNDATIRFVRSVVFANTPGAAAVIDTGTGVSLYVTVQLIEGQPFGSLPTLAFVGDSQLYVQTDGSAFLPAQALYTGIQGESHLLKTQSDTTANRPVVGFSGGPTDGQMYFDTTLGKPIWYFGGSWVDATGTIV
jgi:hypothetical protein